MARALRHCVRCCFFKNFVPVTVKNRVRVRVSYRVRVSVYGLGIGFREWVPIRNSGGAAGAQISMRHV